MSQCEIAKSKHDEAFIKIELVVGTKFSTRLTTSKNWEYVDNPLLGCRIWLKVDTRIPFWNASTISGEQRVDLLWTTIVE